MTRGRKTNRLHVVSADTSDARARFIEAMERDLADRGLDYATCAERKHLRQQAAE